MKERSIAPFIILGLGGMLCLAGLLLYGTEAIAADLCLDRGGVFDYLRGVCRGNITNLPVPPLSQRNPIVLLCWTAGALLITASATTLILGKKRKSRAES
ncbi:hypothetical protein [Chitinimonas sp. BJB300]|uniref:hypothetical protein n=1 Tax=Chitinimonas sp. BJB300 TaxID=1559339 RepID=UPI000C1153A3|nr:hypothetical protein [Chitinimonas sp. BJB300]PHV10888.1 hypothetical protein CSQ89_13705 [Chitinimonas sp. BJB300]TSJ88175.1 hypothetical protein FG002_011710 [Chitinimonas sp. BJB300]